MLWRRPARRAAARSGLPAPRASLPWPRAPAAATTPRPGRLRPFEPLEPGKASIYLCGADRAGAAAHRARPQLGHLRHPAALARAPRLRRHVCPQRDRHRRQDPDQVGRVGRGRGGRWAATFERAFSWAEDALGCLPPTYEPRATGHITEMVELMRGSSTRGQAYAADGDVFFDVRSAWRPTARCPGRASTRCTPPATASATCASATRATSPCGRGTSRTSRRRRRGRRRGDRGDRAGTSSARPWRRSTSGPSFDIHGGGLDLVFPHHENELAQSSGAGDGFARYWMHNAWVTMGGEKMSKSLGNTLLVTEMVKRWRARRVALLPRRGALPLEH